VRIRGHTPCIPAGNGQCVHGNRPLALTDTAIRPLKPKAKRDSRTDERGLVLAVFPTGGMLCQYQYRLNGKQERVTLGR